MKKTGILLLTLLAMLLLGGCTKKADEENEYTVYYVNTEGTSLTESKYTPTAATFDELMTELLDKLKQAPSGQASAIKSGVAVEGYERGIDALRIDFSQSYYDLSNTDEVLLRAAIVKTFSQIPGVAKVMITVGSEQLRDAEGQPVPAMDASSFIDTKEGGINSYLYAKLSLYFPDASGKKLEQETRTLHYSSNMVLERVIIEQLIAGPKEKGRQAIFSDAVKIQNVYIKDGVCTVSFDAEANKTPTDSTVTPEVALYAVVNSICATCDDITGVRFEIEGDASVCFRDTVELDQEFSMNRSYLPDDTAETAQEESVQTESGTEVAQTAPGETEQQTEQIVDQGSIVGVDPSIADHTGGES